MDRKTQIQIVYDEILWLLIYSYVWNQMGSLLDNGDIKLETRYAYGFYMTARDALRENIVLRICRLDDGQKGTWSFATAQAKLNSEIRDQKIVARINKSIKDYGKAVNSIQTNLRGCPTGFLANSIGWC